MMNATQGPNFHRKAAELPPIISTGRREEVPLSLAQQRLWFLLQMEKTGEAYQIPFGFELRGNLDREALGRALNVIVARHEALRTVFSSVDGQVVQMIARPDDSEFHMIEDDLRGYQDSKTKLDDLLEKEIASKFNLETGPLIRGRLVRQSDNEHVLLINMHHIVSDGWSVSIFLNELSVLYSAFLHDENDPLPALALQYADYAMWERRWLQSEVVRRQQNYWREALAGSPTLLEVATDYPRPAQQNYAGAFMKLTLDEKLMAELTALRKRYGTTLYMTLLAGWVMLLARLSGQHDILVGTPVANRRRPGVEKLIGLFINSLTLRVNADGRATVGQLLKQVKKKVLTAQQHQDLPFEQVVEILEPPRSLSHSPLFQVMFAWQNLPAGQLALPGLNVSWRELPSVHRTAKFDMTLILQEVNGMIAGGIEYSHALFEPKTINRYLRYFSRLLEGMAANDMQPIHDLSMLSEWERRRLLHDWNNSEVKIPTSISITALIEAQADRTPEAAAVEHAGKWLTYGDLNHRANQVAHFLRRLGIGPEVRVGICVERGIEMVIGLLGIVKAGGAYVPLDPSYPSERLHYMVEDARTALILTESRAAKKLQASGRRKLELDKEWNQIEREDTSNLQNMQVPANAIYVIYTSGSTGRPKGVIITHDSVNNIFNSISRSFIQAGTAQWMAVTNLCFDIAVLELVWPLTRGDHITIHTGFTTVNGCSTREWKHKNVQCTPTFARAMLEEWKTQSQLPVLGRVLVGGEVLPEQLARELRGLAHGGLYNMYGPTETTVWSCLHLVVEAEGRIPIGRPIANTQVYVLDQWMRLVPTGVAGELYLGGTGLARGYLNQPELTADRFVPNPLGTCPGERLYRTGDRGKWRQDGNLEFLGRLDGQVKLRGYRIELGEIEAILREHEEVEQAVVAVQGEQAEHPSLVAYVVAKPGTHLNIQALHASLKDKLPLHMIPSSVVQLAEMPITTNGKVDRGALPPPVTETKPLAIKTLNEELLAGIWIDVLKVQQVSPSDNFFELGGNSLLAMRILTRIREVFHKEISLARLFQVPVLRDFAAELTRFPDNESESRIHATERVPGGGEFPLSFNQEGRLFRECWADASSNTLPPMHLGWSWRILGELKIGALEDAFHALVERHEALRTSFSVMSAEDRWNFLSLAQTLLRRGHLAKLISLGGTFFRQQIRPSAEFKLTFQNGDGLGEHELKKAVRRWTARTVEEPFDYEKPPLLRATLIRLTAQHHVIAFAMHHLISDGWSVSLLLRDLRVLYAHFAVRASCNLPTLGVQHADFAIWQREQFQSGMLDQLIAYWKQRWREYPPLRVDELPFAHRVAKAGPDRSHMEKISLGPTCSAKVRTFTQRNNLTLYIFFLGVLKILLHAYTGKQHIGILGNFANRRSALTENVVGWFANTHLLAARITDDMRICDLLEQVRTAALEADAHQDVPFPLVWAALQQDGERQGKSRLEGSNILFDILTAANSAAPPDCPLDIQPIPQDSEVTDLGLSLIASEDEDITITAHYFRNQLPFWRTRKLLQDFQVVVAAILETPQQEVSNITGMLDHSMIL